MVELTKPLRKTVGLVVNPNKASITMLLVYEKLPNMCLNCGSIGHIIQECLLIPPEVSMSQTKEWKYSKWFEAQQRSLQRGWSQNSPLLMRIRERAS